MKQSGGLVRISGGEFRGRKIQTPGGSTHPMGERERLALFNIVQSQIEGSSVLDLYCGGGTLGIEAMSRGAKNVTLVDKNAGAISVAKENCKSLDLPPNKWGIFVSDAYEFSKTTSTLYDLVLADPPYDKYTEKMVNFLPGLVKDGGILILSHPDEAPLLPGLKLQKTHSFAKANLSVYKKV